MSGPKHTLTDVARTSLAIFLTVREDADGTTETLEFGVNGNKAGLPYELVRISHDVNFRDGEPIDIVLLCRNSGGDTRLLTLRVEDTKRLLPLLSRPRLNTFRAVRYADDHFTVEYDRADGTPETLTIGVFENRFEYTIRETIAALRDDDDKHFLLRGYGFIDREGRRYEFRMLVPLERLAEFKADENAYFGALDKRGRAEAEAAALHSDEAGGTATIAPSPTTPSPTGPLQIENEHEPTDEPDPKPEAAVIPYVVQQAAFSLGQAA